MSCSDVKITSNLKLLLAAGLVLFLLPACGSVGSNKGLLNIGPSHTLIVEPDDGRAAVTAGIGGAGSSISLTIYSLSDPTVEASLKTARANGAAVRVLYNYFSSLPTSGLTS